MMNLQTAPRALKARVYSAAGMAATVLAGAMSLASPTALVAQTIPLAIVSQSKVVIATINNNAGHVAANSAGDAFYVSQGDNVAYWVPRGRTTAIPLMTGLSGGRSIYVDAHNNVYVPSNYSGTITEIPYINGTYATNIAQGSVPACTTSVPTSPCTQFGSGGSVTSYYYQPTDLGFDAAGNAYVIDEYAQTFGSPGGQNAILKWTLSGTTYTATYISQALPQNNSAQIAVAPNGDVYYADGSNVYYIATGTNVAVKITTTAMTNPNGVASDQYGNIYVTNSNAPYGILEIPANASGVAQQNKIFTFSQGYSANGIAFDGLGDYFYTAYSSNTNLNEAKLYSFNVGSAAPGTATATQTISLLFTGNANAATITATGPGFVYVPGTCAPATAYGSGSSCTVSVTYTPTAVGQQRGAIVLADATGASLVTVGLSGIGLGAAQTSDPGTLSTIAGTFVTPQAVAVDGANNLYIADAGANTVYRYASGSATSTTIGTGLKSPTSVAVDGAGNVYVADSGNGRVVEVPVRAGTPSSAAQFIVVSGLGSSLGIALDPDANLYVADANNHKVFRYGVIDGVPSTGAVSTVAVSGLVAPVALTTDTLGDLFIADTTANTVTEVVNYGKATQAIGTGYSHPSGLATDAANSLYIADTGNNRLLKVPFETPIYNTNDQYAVGTTIVAPYGVAVDASANLYVVDSANKAAYFINRSQGTLPLGRSNLNTQTATLTAYEGNSGNQPLKFGTPDYVATGNTTSFTVTSPAANGCVNGSTIAAGFSCTLAASFDPATVGNFSDLLSFSSNAGNTATPSLTLTGLGLNLAATTLTLTQNGTAVFGSPVSVTATIGSAKAGTPTGTITFYVDGGVVTTQTVNGSTITVSLPNLTGGPHTVAATYTGDNSFAPSNGTLNIVVTKAASTTSLTATGPNGNVFYNPVSAAPGTPVTLTASVVPSAGTIPTGTVTFSYGSTVLGTVPLTGTGLYFASLTTTTLPLGINNVVATYNGDTNYVASSVTLSITIAPSSFTMTPATASLTVVQAGSASTTFNITSLSGFQNYVGLSCTGLPANTVCGFSPNGFYLLQSNALETGYGPVAVVVTVMTGQTPPVPQPPIQAEMRIPFTGTHVPVSFAFLGLVPLTLLLRRRATKRLRSACELLLAVFVLGGCATLFSGCGSQLIGYTPTGTYQVTVTAGSPTYTQTSTITLTVTPNPPQ